MINTSTGLRELAYINSVTDIQPIPNADRIEIVKINGWTCICGKGEFKVGDLGVFFEADAKLPEEKPFSDNDFLASKHYRIRVQKIKGVISDGLFMHLNAFMNTKYENAVAEAALSTGDGRFLTEALEVTYAVTEDNKRKSNSPSDKYKVMAQRNGKLFSHQPYRWLMKRMWGKKLLFIFFGKKKDNQKGFPTHFQYIHKSDEERIENMPYIIEDTKTSWTKTLKIDGTSSTYILERKPFNKFEFYVLSRNVRQLKEDQSCYHDFNVYWYNANKYHIYDFLMEQLKEHPEWKYCCIQGESCGGDPELGAIQGNPHKLPEIRLYGFNFIDSENGRWNSNDAAALAQKNGIPWVPIIDTDYHLVNDFEAVKLDADGPCDIPDASGKREGWVYRENVEYNPRSFKNVSREYLLKQKD